MDRTNPPLPPDAAPSCTPACCAGQRVAGATPAVLVLGANGRIGQATVRAFDAAGWTVHAQVRRVPPPGDLPAGVHLLRVPVGDTAALARAAAGATRVVHALNPADYGRWHQEAMPLLEAGMAVANRLGARLMLPGNVYAYGAGMPVRVTADTPARPTTAHGRIRQRMEDALVDAAAAGRLASTVLTAGDFFGAASGTWFDQAILRSLASGTLVYPGPLDVPHAWAYLPDLAEAFVALAERPAPVAFERLPFPGHTVTGRQLLAEIERVLAARGMRPHGGFRIGNLPWPMIRLMGLVKPALRGLAQMSYLWQVPHALDGAALAARIGAVPHTPLPEALAATLARATGAADATAPSGTARYSRPAAGASAPV